MRRSRVRFEPRAALAPTAAARVTLLVALSIASVLAPAARGANAPEALTDVHVRTAIDAIVDELYARKHRTRYWDPKTVPSDESQTQGGGYTALVVLALLQAGETYQDPRLRDAVAWLERAEFEGTYAVAVRTLVWTLLPSRFEEHLERDATWLLDGFSAVAGGWNYTKKPNTTYEDNSIRQYGALALWAAAERGQRVDPRLRRRLESAFLDCQLANGGWNYRANDREATGSMTTAGLATLFITQDLLHRDAALALGEPSDASARNRDAIARGLAWMDAEFLADDNPGSFRDFYYYLYGVERAALASGVKTFGGRDWFRAGASELLARLCTWNPDTRTMTVNERIGGGGTGAFVRVRHLAFALMFLSRGRVPVAVNKLRAQDLRWNNRPRDAANVTRFLSGLSETELNWQIVDVADPPDTWLDAPMLYFASDRALPWSADDEPALRLRRALDLGGMLFAVNEGSSRVFADSLERLAGELWPTLRFRTLPPDHWAYAMHARVKRRQPVLRALSNGVRELIVLSPGGDLAASFQAPDDSERLHLEIAANLYLYASELNRPRPRLARAGADPAADDPAPRTVRVARVRHAGRWNPEPLALEVFAGRLRAGHGIELDVVETALDGLHRLAPPPALAIVQGTDEHAFTAAERAALRAFLAPDRNGVVLFETPGGRGRFTIAAERACADAFPDVVPRSLIRHRVVTGRDLDGGASAARASFRPYALEVLASRETAPRLRGLTLDGTVRVIFSREDLAHGLLDQPCWGINGYAPDTAQRIMTNIVLHAERLAGAAAATDPDPS